MTIQPKSRLLRWAFAFATLTALSACGMSPRHDLVRGTKASAVEVIDAPKGALVVIDEKAVPVDSKGRALISVQDGWHDVDVMSGGDVVHHQRVFLQDGSHKIIDLVP
ncbi:MULTISPECIES: hypothetical protein [Novosphingobium]|uniref:Lipoprotein n=1 Tax=Novosphingobium decolorationis TaxID=2698673 RepID=A0ABX8E4N8_9SPHN|nr:MULTISPECIES: hypothetical protein [Novosphingobium]QVM84147.1 hypothetical protein HT578_11020 [Novosphingobium decolorationis]